LQRQLEGTGAPGRHPRRESETVARQLKEKDDLIQDALRARDEGQSDIKARDAKLQAQQDEMKALRDGANAAPQGKSSTTRSSRRTRSSPSWQGARRGWCRSWPSPRQIIAKVGRRGEGPRAVEEHSRPAQEMQDKIQKLGETGPEQAKDDLSTIGGKMTSLERRRSICSSSRKSWKRR